MGFGINREKMENDTGGSKEEKYIEAGLQQARLVSYVEMGWHNPIFKGKPATYDAKSKKAGQLKPPEFVIQLTFEFPRCEYTGNFPLCIKTSVPFGKGEFINKLSVSEALFSGNISMTYANRSAFMKYLNAMNDACGTDHDDLHSFLGEAFLITVKNNEGKADKEGNIPVYANMKPDGIQGLEFKNPVDGKMYTADVPESIGTYCEKFFWDAPTEEGWNKLSPQVRDRMKEAVDYPDSALAALVAGLPEENAADDGKPPETTGRPAQPEDDDIPV